MCDPTVAFFAGCVISCVLVMAGWAMGGDQ